MLDLKKIKKIYFVGIKGVGMAALAVLAKERGFLISGVDTADKFPTDALLKKHRITFHVGFQASHPQNFFGETAVEDCLVVVTGAHHGLRNVEAVEAAKNGFKVVTHGEALGLFMAGKKGIAVAGNHGKTTTAALLAHILFKTGFDPSFVVGGGVIASLKTSAHAGKGEYFVAEADEYASDIVNNPIPRFLYQNPEITIITNIDFDHPDFFASLEEVKTVYWRFASKLPANGLLVSSADDTNSRGLFANLGVRKLTFGLSPAADFRIEKISFRSGETLFQAQFQGVSVGEFSLKIPGEHNVRNAAAAFLVANYLGLSWQNIATAAASFSGVKRRFEFIGRQNGINLYDDYGHHPAEIIATLKGARGFFPKARLTVLFQPHTFSRTKALFLDFARCFAGADNVIITDIYGSAREKLDPAVSSALLVAEISKQHPSVYYLKSQNDLGALLKRLKENDHLQAGDIFLTLGAGDIYQWGKTVLANL